MKNILLITLSILLFSCQKEDNTINLSEKLISQKEYVTMLTDINIQYEQILNESKPKNLSISEYKMALVTGKIELSLSQQNRMLNATKPLIDYSTKLAKINSIKIEDLGSLIALGGMYSPNDNLDSKYNENSFKSYEELSIVQSNTINSKHVMKIDANEVLDCALTAIGADAVWALGPSSASAWTAAATTKAFSAIAKRFLGPVGVALAVITFGLCIAHQTTD
jgi:hypothetical protein